MVSAIEFKLSTESSPCSINVQQKYNAFANFMKDKPLQGNIIQKYESLIHIESAHM